MESALLFAGAVCVVVGLAGIVLPGLPGTALVFVGLVMAAASDGFQRVGAFTLVVLGLMTAVSFLVDFAATSLGVKKMGASKWAILGAGIGALLGLFFGIPGLLLGPFLGAMAAELATRRDLRQAGKAGLGAWIGFVFGTIAKLALAFTMLGIFAAAWFL